MRFLLFTALFVLVTLNCSYRELNAQSLQEQGICAAQARKTFQEILLNGIARTNR